MYISFGTSRVVIAVPNYGIVIKIARIRIIQAIRELPDYIKCFHIWRKVSLQSRSLITPFGYIMRGIIENWGERSFYKFTKNPLLQPTYFSILGLVNIQRYSKPLEGVGFSIASTLWKISGFDERVADDRHHFCNSKNFTKDEAVKLRMLDYGFKKTQEVIFAYGERLHNEFIFSQTGTG